MGYGIQFMELLPQAVAEEFIGLLAYLRKFETSVGGLASHVTDFGNPHHVTAAQVGATSSAAFVNHHARHENGGLDEVNVTGLSGELADPQPPKGVVSGKYTPTLTNAGNISAFTAFECFYLRVENIVTVSGRVSVDPTAAGSTKLGISLPVPSDFAAIEDCAGTACASAIAGQCAAIVADGVNNRAQMEWIAVDVTNQPMTFVFTYEII